LNTLPLPTISLVDGAEDIASSVGLGENMEAYSRVAVKINNYNVSLRKTKN